MTPPEQSVVATNAETEPSRAEPSNVENKNAENENAARKKINFFQNAG